MTRTGCGTCAVLMVAVMIPTGPTTAQTARQSRATPTPTYGYRIVHTYPHDRQAFTQGLIYRGGFLYESTGLNGRSTLRKVRLENGAVLQRQELEPQHFAEGLTDWDGHLIQLTWQSNVAFVYERETFKLLRTFRYPGEGWGLTHDARRLIMSDGSAALRFLDPASFQEASRLTVKDGDTPVSHLNELEVVRGEIYANIWQANRIARISPASGRVLGWIDLQGLLPERDRLGTDVLNGIAYDAEKNRLFVTGKFWPTIFEIELTQAR